MIREEKERTVAELHQIFSDAKGIYLTDFTGIDVSLINELRGQFRQNEVIYRVIKNTLALRSIEGLDFEALNKHLNGPTGIAYSTNDALVPGRVINEFQKKNDRLPLKAIIVEGVIYEEEEAKKIIKLPSKEALLAKMLGSLNSPITGFVMVLRGLLRNLANVLDQIREQKKKDGGAPAPGSKKEESTEVKVKPAEEAKAEPAEEVKSEPAEAIAEPAEEAKAESEEVKAEPAEEKADETKEE